MWEILEIYTDSDGYWSYCISAHDILSADGAANAEYFTVSEGELPGYFSCDSRLNISSKAWGWGIGLTAGTGNPLTGGETGEIPEGAKFNFYNCPDPMINVSGCKYLDNDCNGDILLVMIN